MIFRNHARQCFFTLLARQDLCAGDGHNIPDSSHVTRGISVQCQREDNYPQAEIAVYSWKSPAG